MADSTRRMKANKRLEGVPCGQCGEAMAFGEDIIVCEPCDRPYHAECWTNEGGCATDGCENAAMARLEEPPKKEIPLGRKECPHCGKIIRSSAALCPYCKQVPTSDGVYHGPTQTAPGATASLVFGILSFVICGVIFGVLAIVKANEAKAAIARDPRYVGSGMATAGFVLGIIGLVLWALVILANVFVNTA